MGASSPLSTDPNPTLIADLDVGGFDLTNVGNVVATGTFTGLQLGDDLDLNNNDIINVVDITAGGNIQCNGDITCNSLSGVVNIPYTTLTTEAGTGITSAVGGAYSTAIVKTGQIIHTQIYLDMTGLTVSATDLDIIGVEDAANCHLGRITVADCGEIFRAHMAFSEVPAGASTNVVLYSASESTGTEDAAITGLTETELLNFGTVSRIGEGWWGGDDWTALPAAGEYLYITNGAASGAGTFTAGKLMIEFWGYESA